MKKFIIISVILFNSFASFAETKEVPYTLDDRDRIIQLTVEQKALRNEMNSLRNEINAKFESQQRQIDDIKGQIVNLKNSSDNKFYLIMGILLTMFGYLVWDRRTALVPVREKTYSLSEKYKSLSKKHNSLIKTLKDFARDHPNLEKAMKAYGV